MSLDTHDSPTPMPAAFAENLAMNVELKKQRAEAALLRKSVNSLAAISEKAVKLCKNGAPMKKRGPKPKGLAVLNLDSLKIKKEPGLVEKRSRTPRSLSELDMSSTERVLHVTLNEFIEDLSDNFLDHMARLIASTRRLRKAASA